MPHINENGSLVADFNDPNEPDYVKHNQCIAYLRVCKSCGARFSPTDTVCPGCGAPRPRCNSIAMNGDHYCKAHKAVRPLSLYSKIAGTVSDTVLEELILSDDHSLTEEYGLAKLLLAEAAEVRKDISPKDMMIILKDFFTIAEKKKKIEEGEVLSIQWNDEIVNALRSKMRELISVFTGLIREYVPGKDEQKECLEKLRDRTRLVGNTFITAPSAKETAIMKAQEKIPESERIPLAFNQPNGGLGI